MGAQMHVLVFIEHGHRRPHLAGVTPAPDRSMDGAAARNLAMDVSDRRTVRRKLVVTGMISEYLHAA
ncbi:hypothetical protein [Nonomuraea sp. CA-141351]|uniref:hypothetical protein n=1 Tax=Nonomuraea sp. CA-141351 TaxID=3239996 RepID=UPI003D9453DF